MTYMKDCTLPDELLEQVIGLGLEDLPELLRVIINAVKVVQQVFGPP